MYNIQNQELKESYVAAAKNIAAANGKWQMDSTGKALIKNGQPIPDTSAVDLSQLTMGYVLTMCDITTNSSVLQFPIVDTQQIANAPINPLMRLLSMQDSFVVNSWSYFLMMYTGTDQAPNFADTTYSKFLPITYPDNYFLGTGMAGGLKFMDNGMSMFWIGAYLYMEVDKKVLIPYWDCSRHMTIPQTQTAMPQPGFPNQSYAPSLAQYDGATDSYYPVEPTVFIGGGRNNVVKLNLPVNTPTTIAPFNLTGYGTTFKMKACILYHGILAQNSTNVK